MGKVLSLTDLVATLKVEQAGKVVVTTNGCFDLLHVGHLRYLQASRAFGDCLAVALNSDDSIRRLKGPSRPVLPQSERAELLAGLGCVDYVVIFDEDTPEAVLRAVRPTIHVKGAQYTEDTLPEAPLLRELGVQMRFAPMEGTYSTSNLIQRIQSLK
jgi:rfaE bifunctional protein nucleotidyltransferase chain/domain